MRILIADDNLDAAATLCELLNMKGHDAAWVGDGAAALCAADANHPDAVLLDIGMPFLNGYEVAEHIRERSWGRSVLLIAITGYGDADSVQRACNAGFDAHRVKPADPFEILRLLNEWTCRQPTRADTSRE